MKVKSKEKIWKSLFVVLALGLMFGGMVGVVGAEDNETTTVGCFDSDGGLNYYEKGTLKGIADWSNESVEVTECCVKDGTTGGLCISKSNTLNEYFCKDNKYAVETYVCPNGCEDGACTGGDIPVEGCEKYYECPNGEKVQYCWSGYEKSKYDLNRDRKVDMTDVAFLRREIVKYDFNGDGVFDDDDAEEMENYFNEEIVPEAYDLDGDGDVDKVDTRLLGEIFQKYEFTSDGEVDEDDVEVVRSHIGELLGESTCSCIENPESLCSVKPVCRNGICEKGEGMVCEEVVIQTVCEAGKKCEVPPAKCKIICPEDCDVNEDRIVRLNEKFKLDVGNSVVVKDYKDMQIKFVAVGQTKCGVREIYETTDVQTVSTEGILASPSEKVYSTKVGEMTTEQEKVRAVEVDEGEIEKITKCLDGEIVAELRVSIEEEPTRSVYIKLGEKKKVFGVTVAFLDYYSGSKTFPSRTGVFVVYGNVDDDCPERCICSADGTMTCPIDDECIPGTILCPDGKCREVCSSDVEECKFGCLYGESCLPIGTRVDGQYCDIGRNLVEQVEADGVCENNFECDSNVCVNGECVSGNLLQKIIDWFGKFFGGGDDGGDEIPDNCIKWYDGCNGCDVVNGKITSCTEMACQDYKEPKCLAFG